MAPGVRSAGRPAVEVFAGNTADPATVPAQVAKLRRRFGLEKVVLVGDRGMITDARIRDDLAPEGLGWITALRAPAIAALRDSGPLQLSLFDERDLAEITDPAHPGERLVVCRNTVSVAGGPSFVACTVPAPLQRRAPELPEVKAVT